MSSESELTSAIKYVTRISTTVSHLFFIKRSDRHAIFLLERVDAVSGDVGILSKKVSITRSNNVSVLPHFSTCAPALETHRSRVKSALTSNRYRCPRTVPFLRKVMWGEQVVL